jgi:hypothetical protein
VLVSYRSGKRKSVRKFAHPCEHCGVRQYHGRYLGWAFGMEPACQPSRQVRHDGRKRGLRQTRLFNWGLTARALRARSDSPSRIRYCCSVYGSFGFWSIRCCRSEVGWNIAP